MSSTAPETNFVVPPATASSEGPKLGAPIPPVVLGVRHNRRSKNFDFIGRTILSKYYTLEKTYEISSSIEKGNRMYIFTLCKYFCVS